MKYSCNLAGNTSSTVRLQTNDGLSQSPGRISTTHFSSSNAGLGSDNEDRIEHVQGALGISEQDYGKQNSNKK